jgi:hypothetical protein
VVDREAGADEGEAAEDVGGEGEVFRSVGVVVELRAVAREAGEFRVPVLLGGAGEEARDDGASGEQHGGAEADPEPGAGGRRRWRWRRRRGRQGGRGGGDGGRWCDRCGRVDQLQAQLELIAAGDLDDLGGRERRGPGGPDAALACADQNRSLEGGDSHLHVVDGDDGAGFVHLDGQVGNASLELLDLGLDLEATIRGHLGAALLEVALEGLERAGVVLEFVAGLPEIVEDAVAGGGLVGALELDERGAKIAFLEEFDAALEALTTLFLGGGGGLRDGDGGGGQGRGDQEHHGRSAVEAPIEGRGEAREGHRA